jgi:Asp-tRNA(Asn)/Glu-tRNA(Gln) amidotransferase C subunit
MKYAMLFQRTVEIVPMTALSNLPAVTEYAMPMKTVALVPKIVRLKCYCVETELATREKILFHVQQIAKFKASAEMVFVMKMKTPPLVLTTVRQSVETTSAMPEKLLQPASTTAQAFVVMDYAQAKSLKPVLKTVRNLIHQPPEFHSSPKRAWSLFL